MYTLAHGDTYYFSDGGIEIPNCLEPDDCIGSADHRDKGFGNGRCLSMSENADLYWATPDNGGGDRPAIFVEAEGHGIGQIGRAMVTSPTGQYTFAGTTYEFDGDDGIVLEPSVDGRLADEPTSVNTVYQYALLSLEDEIWANKDNPLWFESFETFSAQRTGGLTIQNMGTIFESGGLRDAGASPPWRWVELANPLNATSCPIGEAGDNSIGDWFLDPVWFVWGHFPTGVLPTILDPATSVYTNNKFLAGNNEITPIAPTSWEVGQQVVAQWGMYEGGGTGLAAQCTLELVSETGLVKLSRPNVGLNAGLLSMNVPDVPPGNYYLRVRATSDAGAFLEIVGTSNLFPITSTVEIAGAVTTDNGTPISGVQLQGFSEIVFTDSSGAYTAIEDYGWTGTVTPFVEDHSFEPEFLTLGPVISDLSEIDFVGNYIAPNFEVTNLHQIPDGDPDPLPKPGESVVLAGNLQYMDGTPLNGGIVELTLGGCTTAEIFSGDSFSAGPCEAPDQSQLATLRIIDTSAGGFIDATYMVLVDGASAISIVDPQPGARWAIGSDQFLCWDYSSASGVDVEIDISRDGGANWSLVKSVGAAFTCTTIDVGGPASSNAYFRVRKAIEPDVYGLVGPIDIYSVDTIQIGHTINGAWSYANQDNSVDISADGGYLAFKGTNPYGVVLYDTRTYAHLTSIFANQCLGFAFSPTGNDLAAVQMGSTNYLRIYDPDSGTFVPGINTNGRSGRSVAWISSSRIAIVGDTGGDDDGGAIYDTDGSFVGSFSGSKIWSLASDGNYLYGGNGDGLVYRWGTTGGAPQVSRNACMTEIWSIAISPDGDRLIAAGDPKSSCGNHNITVLSLPGLSILEQDWVFQQNSEVYGANYDPSNSNRLAVVENSGEVLVINEQADPIYGMQAAGTSGTDVAWSVNGVIAVNSQDRIRLYALEDSEAPDVSISSIDHLGFSGCISDPTGVLVAEYRIDSGAWIPLPLGVDGCFDETISGLTPGAHSISISGGDLAGNTGLSEYQTVTPCPPLAQITLTSPSDGSSGLVAPVVLTWSDLPDAVAYEYEFHPRLNPAVPDTVSSPAALVETLVEGTEYLWRVRAINECGDLGPWSEEWSFWAGSAPPAQALIYYPLNGDTQNAMGGGYDGLLGGGYFVGDRDGISDSALMLPGAGNYVEVPSNVVPEETTIMFWIYENVLPTDHHYEIFGTYLAGSGAYNLQHRYAGYENVLLFGSHNGSIWDEIETTNSVDLSARWTHVAVTRDGTGMGSIYLDGVLVERGPLSAPAGDHSSADDVSYIGQSYDGVSYPMDGAIDEFRFFDAALSEAEIDELVYPHSVAHWSLDATGEDLGGYANDGIVEGTVPWWDAFGIEDSALSFDGVEDRILIQTDSSIRISYYTISMWIKTSMAVADGQFGYPFSAVYSKSLPQNCGFEIRLKPDGAYQVNQFNSGSGNFGAESSVGKNDGQWHHVAATWDGRISRIYVDGLLEGSFDVDDYPSEQYDRGAINWYSPYEDFNLGYPANTWRIGENVVTPTYFKGVIDECRLFSGAMTENEISELYNSYPSINVSAVDDLPHNQSYNNFRLAYAAPNPFNPQTMIAFEVPRQLYVTLRIFDLSGRLVRNLIAGEARTPGRHEVVWNGRDDAGRQVASGTYFYRLEAGEFAETKRMVLIK